MGLLIANYYFDHFIFSQKINKNKYQKIIMYHIDTNNKSLVSKM